MGLYQLSDKALSRVRETTFQSEGLFERQHLAKTNTAPHFGRCRAV
jgi:hypothetical protein